MTLPPIIRSLSPVGWALAAFAVLVVVVAVWWFITSGARNKADAARARVESALADSRSKSAGDAVEVVVKGAQRDADIDRQTRDNADAIRNAPGADAPVNPAATGAGLRGLCARAAYRDTPRCRENEK